MTTGDIVDAIEMCLTEVKGQLAEGGNVKEAVRSLREAVELLDEFTENGGDDGGK